MVPLSPCPGSQLHDQTAFKAAGVSAPRGPAPLSDDPDEELLADGERTENTTRLLKPEIPPEGLALLKEDLQWLRDIMLPAVSMPLFPWTLVSFCLSWLTVLASAGLARSLLSDRQLSPSKSVDDFQDWKPFSTKPSTCTLNCGSRSNPYPLSFSRSLSLSRSIYI